MPRATRPQPVDPRLEVAPCYYCHAVGTIGHERGGVLGKPTTCPRCRGAKRGVHCGACRAFGTEGNLTGWRATDYGALCPKHEAQGV